MGLQKNVASQKWVVFAFDETDNTAKTGDAAQITGKVAQDWGTRSAITDTNPTEQEDGYYVFDLSQAETNGDVLNIYPESSTANIRVIGVPGTIFTVPEDALATLLTGVPQTKYMGSYGPGVYVDSGAANTNTVTGTDGIVSNPVSTFAAARTIADAIGVTTYYIVGNSDITLAATHVDWTFVGYGSIDANVVNLGSQDVSRSCFENLTLEGTQGGSSRIMALDCALQDPGVGVSTFHIFACRCGIVDDITLDTSNDNVFDACYSLVAGTSAPIFRASGVAGTMCIRHFSGGVQLEDLSASHNVSVETDGQVIFASSNNVNAAVSIRGCMGITDNTAGMANLTQVAAINMDKINAEVDTALADIKLDHLIAVSDADDPVDNSIIAKIASITGDWSTFVPTDDSLQALEEANAEVQTLINGLNDPTAAAVADQVWEEAIADHSGTAGSTAEALAAAAAAGTPPTAAAIADAVWDEDIVAAHNTGDTAGAILDDLLTPGDFKATGFSTHSAADVLAEAITELVSVPAASPTLKQAVALLYMALRNKVDITSSAKEIHTDAGTVLGTKALSDDGTTYTEAEMA